MTITTQPLEIIDFTGGITDYYIDGRPNQGQKMNNFFINPNKKLVTRWGSEPYVAAQIPLGSFRISHLAEIAGNILAFASLRCYYDDAGWTNLVGPVGDQVFANAGANTIISSTKTQDQLFLANDAFDSVQKIYVDGSSNLQLRNAGLPVFPSGASITGAPGAGSTYLYAFVLRYDYIVGDNTFLDRGPVFYYATAVTGGTIAPANGASLTLPVALTSAENWDEANIDVEIYRTIDAGTDFFLVDTVSLGTAAYTDEVTDAILITNEALYTTGGIYSNDTPPKCKFVHAVNNVGYYAHFDPSTIDAGEFTVAQSIPGDVDAVPGEFIATTEEKIRGLSSIFDRPIVLCERYIYRIDGVLAPDGTGDMLTVRIDDRAGCASNNSVVRTHMGLFWAGDVGFYWTDGFKVLNISKHLNETYQNLTLNETKRNRIVGAYDPSNDRVIWAVASETNEVDTCFVLDLKWGLGEEMTFTTMSNGDFFAPTYLLVYDNELYRGDTRGYVLKHNKDLFVDPKIDTAVAVASWEDQLIEHDYWSCFLDFGSKFYRKFVPRILVSAANTTNLSLAIHSSNDNNRVQGDLQPIVYRDNITWGDSLPIWGDPNAKWNYQGIIEEWRRFPAKGLRCQYKQVQFTNAMVEIVDSTLLGTVTVNFAAKTATLGGSYNWMEGIVDYYISFEDDGYNTEFLIEARTPTTVTFEDTSGEAPADGVYSFKLLGKPKGEVLELNGYIIHWSFLSKTHTPYIAGND